MHNNTEERKDTSSHIIDEWTAVPVETVDKDAIIADLKMQLEHIMGVKMELASSLAVANRALKDTMAVLELSVDEESYKPVVRIEDLPVGTKLFLPVELHHVYREKISNPYMVRFNSGLTINLEQAEFHGAQLQSLADGTYKVGDKVRIKATGGEFVIAEVERLGEQDYAYAQDGELGIAFSNLERVEEPF